MATGRPAGHSAADRVAGRTLGTKIGIRPAGPEPDPATAPPPAASGRHVPLWPAAAAAALVIALAVAVTVLALRGGTPTAGPAPTPSASPSPSAPTVAQIYQQVGPSVVVIRTARGVLGSGVIVADDGTILTADHVIDGGGAISVLFADGTTSTAMVAAADRQTDIAELSPTKLPQPVVPATIGGSAQIGGEVVAIGNPLGLTYSVSSGVVSGLDRTANTDQGTFSGLIQFDASVNPGSSGGPLLDGRGNLIGIVESIADPAGDDAFAGIGFAVPIGTALGGGGASPGPGGGGPQI